MTTKAAEINKKKKPVPTTSNETQEGKKETHHKVLVTDCSFTMQTDWTGCFIGSKLYGHGVHIQNNGNLHINAGPKWLGNGKLCMVSRGGMIHKTGPVYVERKGNSKDPGQGKGSHTTISSAKKLAAYSELNYGNHTNETHGTLYIRATHIVLDAVDSLTLKSGDATIMQAGQILTNTPKYKATLGDSHTQVNSSNSRTVLGEDKLYQFDPRATNHIVSFGHVNRRIFGDYKLKASGVGYMGFLGGPPFGYPHVKQRLNGFNLSVKMGNIGIETKLGAIKIKSLLSFTQEASTGAVKLTATAGLFKAKALGVATLEGTGGFTVKGEGIGDIDAGGVLNIKSTGVMNIESQGIVNVKGAMIYLN